MYKYAQICEYKLYTFFSMAIQKGLFGKTSVRFSVRSAKRPFGKTSVRFSVRSVKRPFG